MSSSKTSCKSPFLVFAAVVRKLTSSIHSFDSYHTTKVQTPSADQVKNVNTATSKQDMQQDGEQAVEHLRTLGKLIFTNSEFRKLLKDVGILGRDVAADAAAKAADAARPSEDQLNQVDETAPSNQVRLHLLYSPLFRTASLTLSFSRVV